MKYVLERKGEEEIQVDGLEQDNKEVRSKRISIFDNDTRSCIECMYVSFHV
jgi:hypothetical protein